MFAHQFIRKLLKFCVFIAIWAVLANVLIFFNPTPRHNYDPAQKSFLICTLKDGKPIAMLFDERKPEEPLCQQPYDRNDFADTAYYTYQLDKKADEWQFTSYTDSMSDPWIFYYRIENNQVIPVWYTYGGIMLAISWWTASLFFTAIIYAIGRRVILFQLRKKSVEKST